MRKKKFIFLVLFILPFYFVFFCKPGSGKSIKMATTTSTENSGLLNVLLPVFVKKSGIQVHVIAVGTGKAIKLASNGDVDVILVHSPPAEKKFIKAGFGIKRIPVMSNDFVIIGPGKDEVKLKGLKEAAPAFKKIQAAQALFISRGDHSGTYDKEMQIWKKAGIEPKGKWYLSAGRGMGDVLVMSNEKRAYTLTDRGTYLAFQNKIDLKILCEGDKLLRNPYHIIAVNPKKFKGIHQKEVRKFISWITSEEGQDIIGKYKMKGQNLFYPNYLKAGK